MINVTGINSAKEAPPKRRKAATKPRSDMVLNNGYRCAACGTTQSTTAGSKFRQVGPHIRRVCGECAK